MEKELASMNVAPQAALGAATDSRAVPRNGKREGLRVKNREWVLQAVREAAGVGAEAEGERDTVTVRLAQAEKA